LGRESSLEEEKREVPVFGKEFWLEDEPDVDGNELVPRRALPFASPPRIELVCGQSPLSLFLC
jgi:hypothetical protein